MQASTTGRRCICLNVNKGCERKRYLNQWIFIKNKVKLLIIVGGKSVPNIVTHARMTIND